MSYSAAPIYSATKAGVRASTQALRLQLEDTNVKVMEIIPLMAEGQGQILWFRVLPADAGECFLDHTILSEFPIKTTGEENHSGIVAEFAELCGNPANNGVLPSFVSIINILPWSAPGRIHPIQRLLPVGWLHGNWHFRSAAPIPDPIMKVVGLMHMRWFNAGDLDWDISIRKMGNHVGGIIRIAQLGNRVEFTER